RYQSLGGNAHGRWRRIEEPEVPGVRRVDLVFPQAVDGNMECFHRVQAGLKIERAQSPAQRCRIKSRRHTMLGDSLGIVFYRVDQFLPQALTIVACKLKHGVFVSSVRSVA